MSPRSPNLSSRRPLELISAFVLSSPFHYSSLSPLVIIRHIAKRNLSSSFLLSLAQQTKRAKAAAKQCGIRNPTYRGSRNGHRHRRWRGRDDRRWRGHDDRRRRKGRLRGEGSDGRWRAWDRRRGPDGWLRLGRADGWLRHDGRCRLGGSGDAGSGGEGLVGAARALGLGVIDRDRGADRDDDSDTSVAVHHICFGLLGSEVVRGSIGDADGAMVIL